MSGTNWLRTRVDLMSGTKASRVVYLSMIWLGVFLNLMLRTDDPLEKSRTIIKNTYQSEWNIFSTGNLSQIALLLKFYSANHDGRLPDLKDGRTATTLLLPYWLSLRPKAGDWLSLKGLESKDVFVDPQTKASYQTNPVASGKKLSEISDPSNMALMYEPSPHPDPDHAGRLSRAVAFADGTARRIPESEWPQVEQNSRR